MSIFDRLFPKIIEPEKDFSYTPSSQQAAWFAIIYSAAYTDGKVSNEETSVYIKLLERKSLFKGHQILDYFYEVAPLLEKVSPRYIIDEAVKQIPPEEAPTLFCLVAETLLTEGILKETEKEILAYIQQALLIDAALAASITEVMLIKNKGNYAQH